MSALPPKADIHGHPANVGSMISAASRHLILFSINTR
jgi:hypothetical protein